MIKINGYGQLNIIGLAIAAFFLGIAIEENDKLSLILNSIFIILNSFMIWMMISERREERVTALRLSETGKTI